MSFGQGRPPLRAAGAPSKAAEPLSRVLRGCSGASRRPSGAARPSTTAPSSSAITGSTTWARSSATRIRPGRRAASKTRSAGCAAACTATPTSTRSPPPRSTPIRAANNTPRKCLDYQTPAEVLHNQLLHLQADSTMTERGASNYLSPLAEGRLREGSALCACVGIPACALAGFHPPPNLPPGMTEWGGVGVGFRRGWLGGGVGGLWLLILCC